jgi:hypothetical protein
MLNIDERIKKIEELKIKTSMGQGLAISKYKKAKKEAENAGTKFTPDPDWIEVINEINIDVSTPVFQQEKTLEQKLADALAEIEKLKAPPVKPKGPPPPPPMISMAAMAARKISASSAPPDMVAQTSKARVKEKTPEELEKEAAEKALKAKRDAELKAKTEQRRLKLEQQELEEEAKKLAYSLLSPEDKLAYDLANNVQSFSAFSAPALASSSSGISFGAKVGTMKPLADRPPVQRMEVITQVDARKYKADYEKLKKEIELNQGGKPITASQKRKLISTMSEIINVELGQSLEVAQPVVEFQKKRNLTTTTDILNFELGQDKNILNIIEEDMASKRETSLKNLWETQRAGMGIGYVVANIGTKRNQLELEAKNKWNEVAAGIKGGYETSKQSVIKGFRERMLKQLVEQGEDRNTEIERKRQADFMVARGKMPADIRQRGGLRIENGQQKLDLSNKSSVDDFMSRQLQELNEVEQQLKKEAQGEILDKMKKMAEKRETINQQTYVALRPSWASIASQEAQSGAVPAYELQNPLNYQVAVIPQQPLLGRRGTLAQKLGLEERLSSSLFSSPQQKNSSMSLLQAMARRKLGMDKYDWDRDMVGVENRLAKRRASILLQAMVKRRLATGGYNDVQQLGGILRNMATTLPSFNLEPNMGENNYIMPNIEAPINQQMPRYAKGSSEARDFMARIRGLKKPRRDTSFLKTGQFDASTPALTKYNVRRPRGRPRKTQVRAPEEIQTYMTRAGFGIARPKITRKYTRRAPAMIPTSVAPKRVGRPRKMTGSRVATDSEAQAAFAAGRIGPSFAKQASMMRALMASNPGMSLRAAALSTYKAPRAPRAKAPKTRPTYSKVLMSVPRAVSTGNGAAKRMGRPNKLTTDTARVVKDVLKLQGVRRLRGG